MYDASRVCDVSLLNIYSNEQPQVERGGGHAGAAMCRVLSRFSPSFHMISFGHHVFRLGVVKVVGTVLVQVPYLMFPVILV